MFSRASLNTAALLMGIVVLTILMLNSSVTNAAEFFNQTSGTTFVVNATDDLNDGSCTTEHCSLREAIIASNNTPGTDTVTFSPVWYGMKTIRPTSPLPDITDSSMIIGTVYPLVLLDGSLAGTGANGLTITGGNSVVEYISIVNFDGAGIFITNGGNNWVRKNLIGMDYNDVIGTNHEGIIVQNSANNTIGGEGADLYHIYRNTICSSENDGIRIEGVASSGNWIGDNIIGLIISPENGSYNCPGSGGAGIEISDGANQTLISGENVISRSGGDGIHIEAGSTGNRITTNNHIFQNAGLGINLGDDGITLNDPGDTDVGANQGQNFPTLTISDIPGDLYKVIGTLDSEANKTYRIEFYGDDDCDLGYGEGYGLQPTYSETLSEQFIEVITDNNGHVEFERTFPSVIFGETYFLTALATDPDGNTSEFSACVTIPYASDTAKPYPIAPLYRASLPNQRPTLTWSEVAGEINYELRLQYASQPPTIIPVTGLSYTPPQPLETGIYSWDVRVASSGDADWGGSSVFFVNADLTLLAPSNGEMTENREPTFSWQSVTGTTSYEIQLGETNPPTPTYNVTSASYTPTTPLNAGSIYYWRIRKQGGTEYDWSTVWSVRIKLPQPNLTAPDNGSATNNRQPIFSWQPVTGAAGYEIQLGETNPPTQTYSVVAASYIPFAALNTNTTYYWRVRSLGSINSDWSDVWTLQIKLPQPNLMLPSNGSATDNRQPTFSWQPVTGAAGYEIQINRRTVEATSLTVNTNTYTPPQPLLYDTYFWRVRTIGGDDSDWSDTWEVLISAPLNAQPKINLFTTKTPTLTWGAIPWAVEYEIQVSSNPNFPETNRYQATKPADKIWYTLPEKAITYGSYYWRIRALAPGRIGSWSTTQEFTVNAP
ncbi:MAG TPA: CSLREA domain-containing protein [Phototrophicaceae bacterium]|nr:CSLREA domain-containing protein [Phototrophicaceae bacterium]